MSQSIWEDDFKGKVDWSLWLRIFRYALRHKRLLYPLLGAAVLIAAVDAGFPLVIRASLDLVQAEGADAAWGKYAVLYVGMIFCLASGVFLFINAAGGISNHVSHDIRRECFIRLQDLEFAFFDVRPVGWLISRLTADCDRLARIIAWGFLDLVWSTCLLGLIAGIMLWLNFSLGILVLSVVPPLTIISIWFQKRILLSARDVRKYNSQITAAYNEGISGVRTTKTLVREDANLGEFTDQTRQMFRASFLNARLASLYLPIVMSLGSLAAGLALWRGGFLVLEDALTLGTLVAFIAYTGQFFHPIHEIARILSDLQGAQAAAERVMSLLDTHPAIKDSPQVRARLAQLAGNPAPRDPGLAPDGYPHHIETIVFENVSFAYGEGPPVLHDFNLKVRAGQTIALVGASGGGKSTIVSLLARFYEPTSGKILINGIEYRERSLQWLQGQLGIVLQAPHLFSGTIRENIRYGRLEATDAEVEQAARLVNAHEFIMSMENGYETDVEEGGGRLSTGQKQLISFARALLANPQIFIMDEATSSIDTVTEKLIQEGLREVLRGRISFVIAHRLSTIRSADLILVIATGRVLEAGTHQELLRRRGHYYDLYTNQFLRESEEGLIDP